MAKDKIEIMGRTAAQFTELYVYIKYNAKYMWVQQKKFFTWSEVASNLLCDMKDLKEMREKEIIKDYEKLCYKKWWQKGCYNLLNEDSILKPSENPELDSDIKTLISNVCWHKEENIDWLYKAILYKYLNINSFTIPCVVLFGKWWSWKGTLISLLATVFWWENTTANMWQRDLSSSFDTYLWDKLILEFAEVITNHTGNDRQVLNKLKNMVGAEKITVNPKNVQPFQIENIAWIFISSNSNMPLLLDDKDKWNRRFSIIRSTTKLENGSQINESVKDIQKVSNFLAWLLQNYPEVQEWDRIEELENDEKKDLEWMSLSESWHFWEYYEEKFPLKKGKIPKWEIDEAIDTYCLHNDLYNRSFKKFFWKTSKYPIRRLRIDWKPKYCVEIL